MFGVLTWIKQAFPYSSAAQVQACDERLDGRDMLRSLQEIARASLEIQQVERQILGVMSQQLSSLDVWMNALQQSQLETCVRTLLDGNPRYADPRRLQRHEHKGFSQDGEDGILQEIFRRIKTTNRHFVEFGVEQGTQSNTANLLLQGWAGLWIEYNRQDVEAIEKGLPSLLASQRLRVLCEKVNAENIEALFALAAVPAEPDLISIDIDGNDFWVWRALRLYQPRVVVLEYNPYFPPPTDWVMPYDPDHCWNGSMRFGASLEALERLGRSKGYCLVGCSLGGVNSFFVRQDLVGDHFAAPFTAENHYEPLRKYLLWRNCTPPRTHDLLDVPHAAA